MPVGEPQDLEVAQAALAVNKPFTVHGTVAFDKNNPRDGWLKVSICANNDGGNKPSLGSILINLVDGPEEFDASFETGILRAGKHRLCVDFVGLDGKIRALGGGELVIGSE